MSREREPTALFSLALHSRLNADRAGHIRRGPQKELGGGRGLNADRAGHVRRGPQKELGGEGAVRHSSPREPSWRPRGMWVKGIQQASTRLSGLRGPGWPGFCLEVRTAPLGPLEFAALSFGVSGPFAPPGCSWLQCVQLLLVRHLIN